MPFQSDKQRRYLWANEPEIAREWTNRYGASQGGLTRLPLRLGTGEEMIAMGTPLTNQMAFKPGSALEKTLIKKNRLDELMPGSQSPSLENLLQQDWDQRDKHPLSLEKDKYSGVEGYTTMLPDNMLQTMTDAYSGIGEENTGGIVDVEKVRELIENSRNQGIETTNINELPQTFDAFQDAQDKGYGQFFRNQPVDEGYTKFSDTDNFMEYINKNPELMQTMKDKAGDVLDTGIGAGQWALGAAGAAAKMPFQLMAKAANIVNPLSPGSRNYNPSLQPQIDMLNQMGMLGDQSSPYKITGGVLAGKNLVSGFGTNDYGRMLQKRIDYFQKKKSLTKAQNKKLHDTIAEKKAADEAAAKRAAESKKQWQQRYSNWQSPSGRDHASTAGIGSKESKQGHSGSSHVGASRFQ